MRFWIDIENGAGTKQGAGPIVTAQWWENIWRLDLAGSVKFAAPASDERLALVQAKRIACCQGTIDGVVTDIGVGIIDSQERQPDTSGLVAIVVGGDDMTRELTNDHVGELLIDNGTGGPDSTGPADIIALAPAGWALNTARGFDTTITTIYHQYDGETVLEALVRLAELTGEHFYTTSDRKVVWIRAVGSAKVTHSGITGTYTVGETVTGVSSGAIGTLQEATGGAGAGYLYIESVAGSFVAGETVTGMSSGASCTVGTAYNPSSGVRAILHADPTAVMDNSEVCVLSDIVELEDSYDNYVGRIYAIGSGLGSEKLELNGVTITPPGGYSLGSVAGKGYYLQHDSTWSSYGIARREVYKDIQDVDELYRQAYADLSRAKGGQKAYRLAVIKLDQTLTPGQTLRVTAQRWVDGTRVLNIDADLNILEIATRIDVDRLRTVGLVVATTDKLPERDLDVQVKNIVQTRQLGTHTQPISGDALGNHATSHQNGGADEISVAGLSGELADNQPPKAHKTSHEAGGSDALSGNLSITDLALSGKLTQATNVIRAAYSKAVVDNVATSVFRITTTNETGSNDGGGYSVMVHALVGDFLASNNTIIAAKGFTAQFCRAMTGAGAGANSAVVEDVETASAGAGDTINAVTMTVLETSEYLNDVQFTVDVADGGGGSPRVVVMVELIWYGFLTAPVMSQL